MVIYYSQDFFKINLQKNPSTKECQNFSLFLIIKGAAVIATIIHIGDEVIDIVGKHYSTRTYQRSGIPTQIMGFDCRAGSLSGQVGLFEF